jgi:hypothetical protein
MNKHNEEMLAELLVDLQPIEQELQAKLAAEEAKIPPNIDYCEWCEDRCQLRPLRYSKVFWENGEVFWEGWCSPDCRWLVQQCVEAIEGDNS